MRTKAIKYIRTANAKLKQKNNDWQRYKINKLSKKGDKSYNMDNHDEENTIDIKPKTKRFV